MATCSLPTLKQQACENDFDKLDRHDTKVILVQLLCNLSAGGIVGSSGQIKYYTADPNAEGVVPDDQTQPAIAYALAGNGDIYGWNPSSLTWV